MQGYGRQYTLSITSDKAHKERTTPCAEERGLEEIVEAALMAFEAAPAAAVREVSCLEDVELVVVELVEDAVSMYPSERGLPKHVMMGSIVKLPAAMAAGNTNSTASATLCG